MSNNLQDILGELYAIDPDLRAHEQELLPLLEKMAKMKPIAEPNEAFVQRLRMILREKSLSQFPAPRSSEGAKWGQFFSLFSMKQLQYTLTGLLVGVIVAAPLTYSLTQSGGLPTMSPESDSTQKLFSYSVEDTGSKAFGDISNANSGGRGGGSTEAMSAEPAVAGNSVLPVEPMNRDQSGGGGGVIPIGMQYPVDKMMINPEMTEYHLIFNGQLPELTSSVDVFKRQKGASSADMSKILGSFNTGLIDLKSFAGAKTDMISFYQDTKYGYMGTVSFRDGSISLNQNYEQWPHPENACQDEACFQRYRMKMGDIPTDDTLISIAQAFVNDHDIDLAQYGTPEVDHQWKVQYESMADKTFAYIPDTVRVIFPLLIDGKPVYDEGGAKSGISLGVNVREKKVADAWGIMDQKYQKSAYPAVSDVETIKNYLANYGKMDRQWMPPNTTVKSVDVTLGTPEVSLVRMYSYQNNMSEELMVPALVFPVTNVSEGGYFYQTTITIPLAADLLKERSNNGNPVPMPLIMEDNVKMQ